MTSNKQNNCLFVVVNTLKALDKCVCIECTKEEIYINEFYETEQKQ